VWTKTIVRRMHMNHSINEWLNKWRNESMNESDERINDAEREARRLRGRRRWPVLERNEKVNRNLISEEFWLIGVGLREGLAAVFQFFTTTSQPTKRSWNKNVKTCKWETPKKTVHVVQLDIAVKDHLPLAIAIIIDNKTGEEQAVYLTSTIS